jgi:soluble lytic murein transglycosylase-like protein
LLAATPAHADQVTRWRPYIVEASVRFGIPSTWIERVMRAESAGLTTLNGRPTTSRAGARGLMQLMPGTWAQMRAALRLGDDPHDPHDNILAGAAYLRLMYDRFGYPGLFAAYNAGPSRYAAYLAAGRTLPGETRAYLAAVGGSVSRAPGRVVVQPANGVFFRLGQRAETSEPAVSGDGLFVALARKDSERPTP